MKGASFLFLFIVVGIEGLRMLDYWIRPIVYTFVVILLCPSSRFISMVLGDSYVYFSFIELDSLPVSSLKVFYRKLSKFGER